MADNNKYVQTQKTTLYGSGVSSSDTSIVLSNFVLPDGETLITMTAFGSIGFGTIEPGTAREEQISFTGITQNGDDTATLTGVTRGLNFVSPYDETSAYKFAHAGGSTFIVTNTAGFYNQLLGKGNDETITGKYSFDTIPESSDTPLSDNDLATKKYVDDNVNGGEVSINRIVVAGTAGEALTTGQLVYLKVSDSKWWKVDADIAATVDNIKLGITQGAGDADGIIAGGVLTYGAHTTTGLTANSLYYASNTAGGISATAGTNSKVIGQAISTTILDFDPDFYKQSTNQPTTFVSTSAGAADADKGVKTNESGLVDDSFISKKAYSRVYELADSPATWSKPTGLKYIDVQVWAGGGGGGRGSLSSGAGGAGGGGYAKKTILASALGSTETVTIGAGGNGATSDNTAGSVGGNTTFGSHLTGYGGGAGNGSATSSNRSGGGGGGLTSVGSVGGSAGGNGGTPRETFAGSTFGLGGSTIAGSPNFSGGAGGGDYGNTGGSAIDGGGGGAGCVGGGGVNGGNSVNGGGGGAGGGSNNSYAGQNGLVPSGGGGGGGVDSGGTICGNGGTGGAGRCIVTEYYN